MVTFRTFSQSKQDIETQEKIHGWPVLQVTQCELEKAIFALQKHVISRYVYTFTFQEIDHKECGGGGER